ncbi:MAG: DUF6282 family protein [Thermodesulfobacteriota bacterium]
MEGAIDLHCHAGPSLIPRKLDAVDAARQAAEVGMAAVLIKDHHVPTARDTWYAKQLLSKEGITVDLAGGIALNHSVGGLNPYAAEAALFFGARIVYLPTVSTRAHKEHHQKEVAGAHFPATARKFMEGEPMYLLDRTGRLPGVMKPILELVRDADAILSTGHLSVREIHAVLDMTRDMGLKRVVVNHPTFITEASDSEMVEFVRKGARIEFSGCMSEPRSKFYYIPSKELIRLVHLVGIEAASIGSDLGQHDTPPFVEGLMVVADNLLAEGMKMDELKQLFKNNPGRLLY